MWALRARLSAALGVPAHSPVVPLVVGPEAETMAAARALLGAGFHVGAIRPPTVPAGTCRLRVSLSAAHSAADVDALAAAVRACGLRFAAPLPHLARPPPWGGVCHWRRQDALDAADARAGSGGGGGGGGGGEPAEPPRSRLM